MSIRSFALATLSVALIAASTLTAARAEALTYQIDPKHTDVIASWSHLGFSNPVAHFGDVDGSITYDAGNVGQSAVKVTIPLSGLESHVPAFNEHLLSEDFFDAAKYPVITFVSTRVEAAGDDRLRVAGDLSLHGVTKPVVLDVTINKVGEHPMSKRPSAGFDAVATIKRSDFGIDRNVPYVSDEVSIRITTEASVPKPATDKE